MSDKTEKWMLEDGRRAERRITESVAATGEGEKIIELHVEDERPLRLQQRIVEKRKPIVYEREIHTIDQAGNVVDKKIESVEPRTPMQLVEHIAVAPQEVTAQSVQEDCDCHVTKEEMIETIVTAIKAMKEESPQIKTMRRTNMVESQNLANEIAKRVGVTSETSKDKITWVVIAVLVVGLAYVVFGM